MVMSYPLGMNKATRMGGILLTFALLLAVYLLTPGPDEKPHPTYPAVTGAGELRPGESPKVQKLPFEITPAELAAMWAAEATFFGRVLDQFDQPVPNAWVRYYRPVPPFATEVEFPSGASMRADGEGRFSIVRYQARELHIGVEADGYYSTADAGGDFSFFAPPPSVLERLPSGTRVPPVHRPDASRPVIFRLKKMGPVVPLYSNYRRLKEAAPLLLSLEHTPAVKNPGGHIVLVKAVFDEHSVQYGQDPLRPYFEWFIEVSVVGGGLVERTNRDEFTAPESGYRPVVRLDYKAAKEPENWSNSAKPDFYVRFDDGTY